MWPRLSVFNVLCVCVCVLQVDPKYVRNMRFAKKHNKRNVARGNKPVA